jgi:FkbM family methyltransferase
MLKNILKNALLIFQDYFSLDFKVRYLNYVNRPVSTKLLKYTIWGSNFSTLRYLKSEIFDNKEYYFIAENSTPLIIDCGANIGMSVIYFKYLYPDSKIIAFEPNPSSFHFLKKNIALNHLYNIELHNICLSNNNLPVDFYTGPIGSSSLIGSMFSNRTNQNKITVESSRLSAFIKNQKIDLLKIDVEGAEWLIMDDLIESKCIKNIKRLLIEYHHKIDSSKSKLSSFLCFLEENGYEYNLRTNYQKTGSFQDIFIDAYLNN